MNKISILFIAIAIFTFSSCTTLNKTMREPNVRLELTKADITLSEQFSAEATSTRYFGIDFERLFKKETGNVKSPTTAPAVVSLIDIASIPVIGSVLSDPAANYALYTLMKEHEGYDVILYPQYETKIEKPILGIGFFTKKTTVKVTGRLGKLN